VILCATYANLQSGGNVLYLPALGEGKCPGGGNVQGNMSGGNMSRGNAVFKFKSSNASIDAG